MVITFNILNFRPKVKQDEVCINIEQGRHPVIHQLLRESQQFVPNDTKLSVGIIYKLVLILLLKQKGVIISIMR